MMQSPCQSPQATASSRAARKRSSGLPCDPYEPSSKRTCEAELLRAGSIDSDESAQLRAADAWRAAAPPMSASPSVVADAAAGDDFASCLGSAESHQSRLAVPPSSASPVAAVGPTTAAAAAGAAALQEAQVAADAAEAHPFLPTRFLNELAAANECLKRLPLPGGLPFHAVHSSCAMLPLCCAYGIPPAAVALGASYFQRLLAGSEGLHDTALQCGFFSWVSLPGAHQEVVMHAVPGQPDLLTILTTCIYLGVKVADGPQFARQLSSMLSQVLGAPVPSDKAADLEMRCLKNLRWRLGPYCCAPSTPARV